MKPTNKTKLTKVSIVIITVALMVVSGCARRGGGDTSDPCRCPTLVEVDIVSVTGQPVGVEQLFDGYDYNAASATVSVASGDEAQVMLEILRLDGTVVDAQSVTVVGGQGWVTIGSGLWSAGTEDVLVYRLTTTGADPVFFDYGIVGLAT